MLIWKTKRQQKDLRLTEMGNLLSHIVLWYSRFVMLFVSSLLSPQKFLPEASCFYDQQLSFNFHAKFVSLFL